MSRKIPNRPHPTPDPEKHHAPPRTERSGIARPLHDRPENAGPGEAAARDAESEEPTYDSCFDDLNLVLSQSMEEPDPDPNLGTAGDRPREAEAAGSDRARSSSTRGKPPRTSEIFRSVIMPGADPPTPAPSPAVPPPSDDPGIEIETSGLNVLDDDGMAPSEASRTDEHASEGSIPWGHIALLSYASVLTLALMWLLWNGIVRKSPATEPPALEKATTEADAATSHEPAPSEPPPPPIPAENVTTVGRPVRIGDLEVTPVSIEATRVELIRAIDSKVRRSEKDCLVLRLKLVNLSRETSFAPLDRNLVRERELRAFDPYIEATAGRRIALFPLAMDSEWSIRGQKFPALAPGETATTFVAAEPGSADDLPDAMTWRLRLRIGVYRSDMLGIKFTRSEVRRRQSRR